MWVALREYPNSITMKLSNQYTNMYQHPTIYITSVISWVMLKIYLNITNKHSRNNCHNTVLSPRKVPCFLSPRIHPTDEPEDSCPTEGLTPFILTATTQQKDFPTSKKVASRSAINTQKNPSFTTCCKGCPVTPHHTCFFCAPK